MKYKSAHPAARQPVGSSARPSVRPTVSPPIHPSARPSAHPKCKSRHSRYRTKHPNYKSRHPNTNPDTRTISPDIQNTCSDSWNTYTTHEHTDIIIFSHTIRYWSYIYCLFSCIFIYFHICPKASPLPPAPCQTAAANWFPGAWDDFSVFLGVILKIWRLLYEDLDDHFGHPGVHRDTSWDTLVVQTWILLILLCFGSVLGVTLGTFWIQNSDFACGNRRWHWEVVF